MKKLLLLTTIIGTALCGPRADGAIDARAA